MVAILKKYDLPLEDIDKINNNTQNVLNIVNNENASTNNKLQNIILQSNMDILNANEELKDLKKKYDNRALLLKKKIESLAGITFDEEKLEESIESALNLLDSGIEIKNNELIENKENELIYSNQRVTISNNIEKDIANSAINLLMNLKKTYEKVEAYVEDIEVVNLKVKDYSTSKRKDLFREPNLIFLYPIPENDDSFILNLVVKFKSKLEDDDRSNY